MSPVLLMLSTLDHLENRVLNAVVNLAHGLEANGGHEDVLPIGNISVKQTADGVNVKFIEKPARSASKLSKDVDES